MSPCRATLVLSAVLMAIGGHLVEGQDGVRPDDGVGVADSGAISERVAELDDEQFLARENASAALLEIGEAAVPQLLAVAKSKSAEQRMRAAELVRMIHGRRISREFRDLGQCPDDAVDVEHGMWLIALILDPGVSEEAIGAKLDGMAQAVRHAIGDGVEPGSLAGRDIMSALTGVLRDQYGLKGDEANYNHPDNSSIHRVLEQRDGLPILLSEIAVAVGRRLDVPIVGIPFPGRYLIKYDGSQAPDGAPDDDVVVDPFGGWQVKPAEQLGRPNPFFDRESILAPSGARQTLERMLNNLEADFADQNDFRQARAVRGYRALLTAPQAPSPSG